MLGFFQALGVTFYCGLVGLLFWKGNEIFGQMNYLGPVLMLVLLSASVLICALIVFYRPYRLFFDGKKKEASELVLSTTAWLFVFFLVFLFIAYIS